MQKISTNHYGIIMAGGVGSRFWPLSKSSFPKQFHDILGTGRTLIQMTFERLLEVCPKENILIVTSEQYKELVLDQLPEIEGNQVLCEPGRKNTAPCIAYASYKIKQANPQAKMLVAPADHLILNQAEFTRIANKAFDQLNENATLITLGIKPSRPDTGYGYIQFEKGEGEIREVISFTEKPELQKAEDFLRAGNYFWNSGIFIWKVDTIIESFTKLLPELHDLFKKGETFYNTERERDFINEIYPLCPEVSIDYGIMEKANGVLVLLSDFGWSDLGTWASLYGHLEKDEMQNGLVGNNIMMLDSSENMVKVPEEKLVVINGLDNYIVVDSEDVLLITPKDKEQEIKQIVSKVKEKKSEEYV